MHDASRKNEKAKTLTIFLRTQPLATRADDITASRDTQDAPAPGARGGRPASQSVSPYLQSPVTDTLAVN